MTNRYQNLHLGLSCIIVVGAALVYGVNPSYSLPFIFGFEVENTDLKNIFRSIMGLYLGFSLYWFYGTLNKKAWRFATLMNVIFMGGLASGRALSLLVDGVSLVYSIGMAFEYLFAIWGLYNLYKYR